MRVVNSTRRGIFVDSPRTAGGAGVVPIVRWASRRDGVACGRLFELRVEGCELEPTGRSDDDNHRGNDGRRVYTPRVRDRSEPPAEDNGVRDAGAGIDLRL